MMATRLSRAAMHQRAVARALWGAIVVLVRGEVRPMMALYEPPAKPGHPCELCRCRDGFPGSLQDDHAEDCPWRATWCLDCAGDGCCNRCGGDGVDPDASWPPGGES